MDQKSLNKKKLQWSKGEEARAYWTMVLPAFLIYAFVMAFPTALSLILSVSDYNGGSLFNAKTVKVSTFDGNPASLPVEPGTSVTFKGDRREVSRSNANTVYICYEDLSADLKVDQKIYFNQVLIDGAIKNVAGDVVEVTFTKTVRLETRKADGSVNDPLLVEPGQVLKFKSDTSLISLDGQALEGKAVFYFKNGLAAGESLAFNQQISAIVTAVDKDKKTITARFENSGVLEAGKVVNFAGRATVAPWTITGLQKYVAMFEDINFWYALKNNAYVILISVFGQIPLGFTFAYIIYRKLVKAPAFWQGVLYMPSIISVIVIGILWQVLFSPMGPLAVAINTVNRNNYQPVVEEAYKNLPAGGEIADKSLEKLLNNAGKSKVARLGTDLDSQKRAMVNLVNTFDYTTPLLELFMSAQTAEIAALVDEGSTFVKGATPKDANTFSFKPELVNALVARIDWTGFVPAPVAPPAPIEDTETTDNTATSVEAVPAALSEAEKIAIVKNNLETQAKWTKSKEELIFRVTGAFLDPVRSKLRPQVEAAAATYAATRTIDSYSQFYKGIKVSEGSNPAAMTEAVIKSTFISSMINSFADEYSAEFLKQRDVAMLPILFVILWLYTGYFLILFLANMQKIDVQVIEAASIDGATEGQVLWHIILPSLSGVIATTAILAISGSLRSFGLVFSMTGGGPADITQLLAIYAYKFATRGGNPDYAIANAVSTVMIIISLALIGVTKSVEKRFGGKE